MSGEFRQAKSQRALVLAEIDLARRLAASRRRASRLSMARVSRGLRFVRFVGLSVLVGAIIGDQAFDQWRFYGLLGLSLGMVLAGLLEIRRVLAP